MYHIISEHLYISFKHETFVDRYNLNCFSKRWKHFINISKNSSQCSMQFPNERFLVIIVTYIAVCSRLSILFFYKPSFSRQCELLLIMLNKYLYQHKYTNVNISMFHRLLFHYDEYGLQKISPFIVFDYYHVRIIAILEVNGRSFKKFTIQVTSIVSPGSNKNHFKIFF